MSINAICEKVPARISLFTLYLFPHVVYVKSETAGSDNFLFASFIIARGGSTCILIFIFSKQSFNESLDFCNRS